MIKNIIFILIFSFLHSMKPLSFKAFDVESSKEIYGRGGYLIVLAKSNLYTFLEDQNESLGGDFIKFKQKQGFDVNVISYEELGFTTSEQLRDYIHANFSNSMLEYVLLIGDVNGTYAIPPFLIQSYNEQEIDVTDYPYTFIDVNDYQNPSFLIGRWPIREPGELLAMKVKTIQYISNENLINSGDDLSFYNKAMLVAGNYKTAEGAEVPPNEWPVTPVWTSLWLYDELLNYGYETANIDTAFFHQNNYETATNNPLIKSSWDEGLGVINYRGWGDATGWHKPSFHLNEATSLSNQWRLPVVMSFVCNTGDFGNDYFDPAGFSKSFGELLVTSGSLNTPKGAVAMVGPSDLDTDTRFNNVMCGVMWNGLLSGATPEIASALHYGKNALINEFPDFEIPNTDGMTYDFFYHHVYTVLGDPSLPVLLESPKNILTSIDDEEIVLNESHIIIDIFHGSDRKPIKDVVGVLFKDGEPLVHDMNIARGLSDSNGQLIIDFDLNNSAELTLYLNKPQFLQREISIEYSGDQGEDELSENITVELFVELVDDSIYGVSGESNNIEFSITNISMFDLDNIEKVIVEGSGEIDLDNMSLASGESGSFDFPISIPVYYEIGDVYKFYFDFIHSSYDLYSDSIDLTISNNNLEYLTTSPSPECDYGYKAFDDTDIDYIDAPEYNWIELNSTSGAKNLGLQDDTIKKEPLPFNFKYFGKNYEEDRMLTICSNGWVSLGEVNFDIDHFWNFSIPNPMGPPAMIAPFMDDLDDNGGTEDFDVWYFYDEDNHRLIIEWDNVSNGEDDQNCPNCIKESFQMILLDPIYYPTNTGDGEIIFQYKSIYDIDENGVYSTIGIESHDQDDGIQYLYNKEKSDGAHWVSDPMTGEIKDIAIKFTTGSSECIPYDINLDGYINIVDIIAVVSFSLDIIIPTSQERCSADFNVDGEINVTDIVALVEQVLNAL